MAGFLLEKPIDGLERETPAIALRILFGKNLAHDGLQRSVGGGKRDVRPEFEPR